MKALTLTQPWATLVAIGAKRIETRSWNTQYRGPLAIHAAKGFPETAQFLCFKEPFRGLLIQKYSFICGGEMYFGKHKFPLGCIVATCNLTRIDSIKKDYDLYITRNERAFGDYSEGRFAWILEDIKPLDTPIPAKGSLGLWNWIENVSTETGGKA